VGIVIDDDGSDWSSEIEGDLVESVFVTENDIFDFVGFEVSVIEDSVQFHLSDSVLSSEIASLFDSE